jgi:hypothetical protein
MKWRARIILLAPAIYIGACAGGTVIVDYAVKAHVTMRDITTQSEESGDVLTVPRHKELLSRYDSVKYRGRDLEWSFGTGTLGMGGDITNHSTKPLCLRFDQAQVRSNLSSGALSLKIFHWAVFRGKWSFLGSTDPKRRREFAPPSLCLASGEHVKVTFAPDLKGLFPTQKMFNVEWPDNEPRLTQKGVGNWLSLSLPVEVGDQPKALAITLTAIDSNARISNY